MALLTTVRDGKASRLESFMEPQQALEAAGLREQPGGRSAL